jgi:glycosyltransferase involved in cell wall biosynthesis
MMMLTLNEEGAIGKVIDDIRRVVPEAEIIVVDSSKDKTPEIAQSKGCTVVRQFPPRGYGYAMDAGLKAATRPYVITLDCDDTYPCDAIKDLLVLAEQGYDLVSASRLGHRPKNMPLGNYFGNMAFVYFTFFICGVRSSDVHTGMRMYRKTLLDSFTWDPSGPALPVEMQVGPLALGYKCTEIFIDYNPRIGESKLQIIPSTIWTLRRIWNWRMFFNPRRAKKKQTA